MGRDPEYQRLQEKPITHHACREAADFILLWAEGFAAKQRHCLEEKNKEL